MGHWLPVGLGTIMIAAVLVWRWRRFDGRERAWAAVVFAAWLASGAALALPNREVTPIVMTALIVLMLMRPQPARDGDQAGGADDSHGP